MDKKQLIIEQLDVMRQGDLIRGEKWSAIAYSKAINAIKGMDKPLTSVEDVEGMKGIGDKIRLKIKEILETGKLGAAERTRSEIPIDIYNSLLKIHGVGPAKAKQLVNAGITTIDSLRSRPDLLNDVQRIGLKYYDDLQERIPRSEMKAHDKFLHESLPADSVGVVVGSYRRMAPNSGDIDMLITMDSKVKNADQKKAFADYIESLKKRNYISDILAEGPKKCMAVSKLPWAGKYRRLDLLLTPESEFAYAILYFTGSDRFNVAFRAYAQKKGYTLNEHIMKPVEDGKPEPPFMKTEQDIFTFLGLKYVEPENRKSEADVVPV
jgi:DNA polymerase beta